MLGGLLLSSCGSSVSLHVDGDSKVEIYTNYDHAENPGYADIDVRLEGSSAGVGVTVLSGKESIEVEDRATHQGGDNYTVRVNAKKGGDAKIRIYAIEDVNQSKDVDISVYTILERLVANGSSIGERNNLFVVKGVDKQLVAEEHFDLRPADVNVKDIVWVFENAINTDNPRQLKNGNDVVAEIVDNKTLKVYEGFNLGTEVVLRAHSLLNPNARGTVTFRVLENSSIESLTLSGDYIDKDGVFQSGTVNIFNAGQVVTDEVEFELKRNDERMAVINGRVKVNTAYDVTINPVVYQMLDNGSYVEMPRVSDDAHGIVGYDNYFSFDIKSKTTTDDAVEYEFIIDAQDIHEIRKYGDFKFALKISYADYAYDIITNNYDNETSASETDITIKTLYFPTRVEISNQDGKNLNNGTVDIFSDYNNGYGYLLKTKLIPDDVVIASNSMFYIVVNARPAGHNFTSVSEVLNFYQNGNLISFTRQGDNFVSRELQNGSDIYVSAGNGFGTALYNYTIQFVSVSNQNASTNLNLNLYRIDSEDDIEIEEMLPSGDYAEVSESYFISSSRDSAVRSKEFVLRVKGISSLAGLSLEASNKTSFTYSGLSLVPSTAPSTDPYIIVRFTVGLLGTNFEAETQIWLSHVTGRETTKFTVETFVPATSASIVNGDKSSSDVHVDESCLQDYVLDGITITHDTTRANRSVSKLMLEAGTSLPLTTTFQSLSDRRLEFRFLTFDRFQRYVMQDEGIADAVQGQTRAEELFRIYSSMDYVARFYENFENIENTTLFTISENRLRLTSNAFKGYVCVLFHGYDENHADITLARFFALESFYGVRYVRPDVRSVSLYTSETLSEAEMNMSYTTVTVSFRADSLTPTYPSNIRFSSEETLRFDGVGYENQFYRIDNISFDSLGRTLSFRITANSTKNNTRVVDVLKLSYNYSYTEDSVFTREAEIQIEIKNAVRVEKVTWQNEIAGDRGIYLDLTSQNESDKTFIISTSTSPASANNNGLAYRYVPVSGAEDFLRVDEVTVGQTFNLGIGRNLQRGGNGYLYLLPNDMVKTIGVLRQILVYEYVYDAQGEIVDEIAHYIPLSRIGEFYDVLINGGTVVLDENNSFEISNFFLNNSNSPVYNKDIILKIKITIADGETEDTAIRIYNETGLKTMNSAKYYTIMNNLTLTDWQSIPNFSGMLAGIDKSITLTFTGDSGALINNLTGTVKNLTFAGNVKATTSEVGFVASRNSGIIENVVVDVYYTTINGKRAYTGSKLTADVEIAGQTAKVGGVVGYNLTSGIVRDSFVYGLNIVSDHVTSYTGGIAGQNDGEISNCGVEFYNFEGDIYNTIKASVSGGTAGGIAGFAGARSRIYQTYAYAYPMAEKAGNVISGLVIGGFVGGFEAGATVEQSFVFLGDIQNPINSGIASNQMRMINSYITYRMAGTSENTYTTRIYTNNQISTASLGGTTISSSEINSVKWNGLVDTLSSSIWEVRNIDSNINFGFMYLKNTTQSMAVDFEKVAIQNITSPRLKALSAGKTGEVEQGILFYYNTTRTPGLASQRSELQEMNTIRISDLFGVSEKEAESLLLLTDSRDVAITSNSITLLNSNTNAFNVYVYSKMDFRNFKQFSVVVLNYLPTIVTTLDGYTLEENQIVMLQTNKSRRVVIDLDGGIYLVGERFETVQEENFYQVRFDLEGNNFGDGQKFVDVRENSDNLILNGVKSHGPRDMTYVSTYVGLNISLPQTYLDVIKGQRNGVFAVSVYDGATALAVRPDTLRLSASEHRTFDVDVQTDNASDNIVIGLLNNGQVCPIVVGDNSAVFTVDDDLVLNFTWTKTQDSLVDGLYHFKVTAKIDDEHRHLIKQNYNNLTVTVNVTSQQDNTDYVKQIALQVFTQEVQSLSMSVYTIEDRQIRNSTLYMTPSTVNTSTLVPTSDAILTVTTTPAYALMTHFTLTYSATAIGNGSVGSVSLSRLMKDSIFGFYANSTSTTAISNGIRVNLTDTDKMGDGVFYFRVYLSSAFTVRSNLRFTLTYYNNDTVLKTVSTNINVDFLASANLTIGEEGDTTYLLAKGESVKVYVKMSEEQKLYRMYLQNSQANINLSEVTENVENGVRTYSATLTAYVDAKLTGDRDSGLFYVYASVERTVNNKREIKESFVTVCLVDFSVDGKNITISSSGNNTTQTINGQQVNVGTFYSYVGATSTLNFNYPFLPEHINYDANDSSELEAYNSIMGKRNSFLRDYSYRDDSVGYYINYEYNAEYGIYNKLSLTQQLYYVNSNGDASRVWNSNYNQIVQHDNFTITAREDGLRPYFEITGTRSGVQLMKLRTTVIYQGVTMYYDCYFNVNVSIWSDEDTPTQISTTADFLKFLKESSEPDDYILMNDIVLEDYEPIDTSLIKSLDGNGYTIHLNSFALPTGTTNLQLALFTTVNEDTTLKNIRVNIYNGGQISVNTSVYTSIQIAGFAIVNEGIIYNCEVVAHYDSVYQNHIVDGDIGLVVRYTNGINTTPIILTSDMEIESEVYGFVGTNNNSVMNSRVGGESFRHIVNIAGTNYIKSEDLGKFTLTGQGSVAGFVGTNAGYISASFVDEIQINNQIRSSTSQTAGFALNNQKSIQSSYVEGVGEKSTSEENKTIRNVKSNIASIGYIGGFVYTNSGSIKNSYSNIAIENTNSKPTFAAGFVYINESRAEISLCYTASDILKTDTNQMPFSGVDDAGHSLNNGVIESSYYYDDTATDSTNQMKLTSGVKPVTNIAKNPEDILYGFSFSSGEKAYDGIWTTSSNGITLVSANKIAFSNRYAVTAADGLTNIFYNKNIIDADTMQIQDLSYGSIENPIIIRNASEFAKVMGKATALEISSYKEYYNDTEVWGKYRIVSQIDMSEIDQNNESEGRATLTTFEKTFSGILDGNGFTISNVSLASLRKYENFGLFAKLYNAVVMNMDFTISSVHNSQANIVGALAGTAVNSRIIAITLSPVSSTGGSGTSTTTVSSIYGVNMVGGVVGMLLGESKIADVNVTDIDVFSSAYKSGKRVGDNNTSIGEVLRNPTQNRRSIESYVQNLSYAGAIAGYVDIHSIVNNEIVKYNATLRVSDYDIVKVHVTDTVNIYGEVAGGLFGYVGDSTYVYDATLELNSNASLTNPSYIIAKNLYAGGLVGENYGGLFAVSVKYSADIQDAIEEDENKYYTGTAVSPTRTGQQTIFSFTNSDRYFLSRYDDALYIGGIVGYMGGGYISVGYSKINVIAHSARTLAVGGVVGAVGYSINSYQLAGVEGQPYVNIFLQEIYSSGDVYIDGGNGVAAGIIGAIGRSTSTPVVALKYVMALNNYSYNGTGTSTKLSGDVNPQTEGNLIVSDKHFMMIGGYHDFSAQSAIAGDMSTPLYIVSSANDCYNVPINLDSGAGGADSSKSTGGYGRVKIGRDTNGVEIKLNPYGFKMSTVVPDEENHLIYAKPMGESEMDSLPKAYSVFESYFISNGWSTDYWQHETDTLFPYIELFKNTDVLFWDATVTSTIEVLNTIKDSPYSTIVVRGRISDDEGVTACKDIDLRVDKAIMSDSTVQNVLKTNFNISESNGIDTLTAILTEFKGSLVSYADYMETADANIGKVSEAIEGGGKVGDEVGFILDRPLFTTISDNAYVRGLSFYLNSKKGNEVINYSIVRDTITDSTFQSVNVVLNTSVVLDADIVLETNVGGGVSRGAGLIAKDATSSNLTGITLTLKNNATITVQDNLASATSISYLGVLVGRLTQAHSFNSISVQNFNIENESGAETQLTFKAKNGAGEVYAGLYAGKVTKNNDAAKISIGLARLQNINVSLEAVEDDSVSNPKLGKVYIGGFVGAANSIDNVSFTGGSTTGGGIYITQNVSVGELYVGLAFGSGSANISLASSSTYASVFTGALYQAADTVDKTISVDSLKAGGIMGEAQGAITIQGFSVNFDITKLTADNEVMSYKNDDRTSKLDANLYDYSDLLSPFKITNTSGTETYNDTSVGGFVGNVSGGNMLITNTCNISGVIDVEVEKGDISVGGLVGQLNGGFTTNISSENSMDVSVKKPVTTTTNARETTNNMVANIGGVIGHVLNTTNSSEGAGADKSISINDDGTNRISVIGNLLSKYETLNFGGAIGNFARAEYNSATNLLKIGNVVYGGAVRVYGEQTDDEATPFNIGSQIHAGGIVGNMAIQSTSKTTNNSKIHDCLSYGDVFVNYMISAKVDTERKYFDSKLTDYSFGGIVAVAGNIDVENCSSLMTNFNERFVNAVDDSTNVSKYNVGAIVGKNSGLVEYSGNVYSSGVTMAYQVESGNQDLAYGDVEYADGSIGYSGYTSIVAAGENAANVPLISSTENIMNKFNILGTFVAGHKLNPVCWTDRGIIDVIVYNTRTNTNSILGSSLSKFHNISWVYVDRDVRLDLSNEASGRRYAIGENLVDLGFVGNGFTFSIKDERTVTTTSTGIGGYGGLVSKMGLNDYNDLSSVPQFSMISGLVLDMDVTADINSDSDNVIAPYYGGIAGQTFANSFIYGVGVKGKISVGGKSSTLVLGGIVGEMAGGFINECYMDADITYRGYANESAQGQISGIANLTDSNNTIKSTYSSGLIESYINNKIHTFSSWNSRRTTDNTSNDILDCYSISQTKITDVLGEGGDVVAEMLFIHEDAPTTEDDTDTSSHVSSKINILSQVFNGSYDIKAYDASHAYNLKETEDMSIDFSGDASRKASILTNSTSNGITQWYFSPFTNYGYASHGFGYLKNVTTYTRSLSSGDLEESEDVDIYEYNEVPYQTLVEFGDNQLQTNVAEGESEESGWWFFGIPNQGKFEQMFTTIAKPANEIFDNTSNQNLYKEGLAAKRQDYRFRLRYDFDMTKVSDFSYGGDVGLTDRNFILDGDGNTLLFNDTKIDSAVFGEVQGRIENLRFSEIKVEGGTGTVAEKVIGQLNNIAVVGDMTIAGDSTYYGGVVGILEGSARAIEAVVNITSTYAGKIIGGVVGKLGDTSASSISYSSSSGQIIGTGNNSGSIDEASLQSIIYPDFKTSTDKGTRTIKTTGKSTSVLGGVVGIASNESVVDNCYNANAILNGFTGDSSFNKQTGNFVAGGVVGYSAGATISNSYNTGFVGAGNYNNAKDSNAAMSEGEIVYSTGLAFAGGIFGYGTKGTSVTNCINDAAVEAIGETPTQKISYTRQEESKLGTETNPTSANSYPENVEVEVTMVYNESRGRQVYAYGIGYVGSIGEESVGLISGCTSSTNNIKNDGIVGEINETNKLVLDRRDILDNKALGSNNIDTSILGSFYSDGKLYVSGYDSYGFTSRVYMTDTVKRSFARDFAGNKAIQDAYTEMLKGVDFVGGAFTSHEYANKFIWSNNQNKWISSKWIPEGEEESNDHWYNNDDNRNNGGHWQENFFTQKEVMDEMAKDNGKRNWFETHPKEAIRRSYGWQYSKGFRTGNDRGDGWAINPISGTGYNIKDNYFGMEGTTTYACSLEFTGYDNILKDVLSDRVDGELQSAGRLGLVGYNENLATSCLFGDEYSTKDIEEKINAIDTKREKGEPISAITINGERTSVVKSNAGLTASYTPVKYVGSIEISKSDLLNSGEKLDERSITKNSFEITATTRDIVIQAATINSVNVDESKVKLDFEVYLDKSIDPLGVKIDVSYRVSGTVTLGQDNVISKDGKVYILLEDNAEEFVSNSYLSDFIVEELNNPEGDRYVCDAINFGDEPSLSSGTSIKNNCTFGFGNLPEFGVGNAGYLIYDGSLNATSFKDKKLFVQITDKKSSYESKTYNLRLNRATDSPVLTVSKGSNAGSTTLTEYYERYVTDCTVETITNGSRINLTELLNRGTYTAQKMAIADGDYKINYLVGREEEWQFEKPDNDGLEMSIQNISGVDWLEITSTADAGASSAVSDFVNKFKNFIMRYNKNEIQTQLVVPKTVETTTSSGEFTLKITHELQLEDESVYNDGKIVYTWEQFDAAENKVVDNNFGGLDFYKLSVSWDYTPESAVLTYTGAKQVGYTVYYGEGSNRKMIMQNAAKELSLGSVVEGDKFTIEYIKTSYDNAATNTEFSLAGASEGGVSVSYEDREYKISREDTDTSLLKYNIDGSGNLIVTERTYTDEETGDIVTVQEVGTALDDDNIIKKMIGGTTFVSTSYETYTPKVGIIGGDKREVKYRVYSNGAISVEYWYYDGDGNVKTNDTVMFIADADSLKQGKGYSVKGQNVTYTYEAGIGEDGNPMSQTETMFVWRYDNAVEMNIDDNNGPGSVFDSYDVGVGGVQYNVELVVGDFDEADIYIVKSKSGQEVYDAPVLEAVPESYTQTVSLYQGQVTSFVPERTNYTDFEKRNDNGTWSLLDSDESLSGGEFGGKEVEYRYITNFEVPLNLTPDLTGEVKPYVYVIIANDIHIYNKAIKTDGNDKTLIGNGYIVKFVNGLNQNMFGTNTGKISDVNLVGIVSLSGLNRSYSLISSGNAGTLKNLAVYGTLRNIKADNAGAFVSPLANEFNSSSTIGDLQNYMVVVGNDGQYRGDSKNVSVNVNIKDTCESDEYTSRAIILAGNGGKGDDGADGSLYLANGKTTADGKVRSGTNGTRGGNGGNITVSATFEGYAREGIRGYDGYGGNGANGKFVNKDGEYVVYHGGEAGVVNPTTQAGVDGKLDGDIDDEHKVSVREVTKTEQKNGIAGIGGFGRIYRVGNTSNYKCINSGKANASRNDNTCNSPYDWLNTKNTNPRNGKRRTYAFGYTQKFGILNRQHTFAKEIYYTESGDSGPHLGDQWRSWIKMYMESGKTSDAKYRMDMEYLKSTEQNMFTADNYSFYMYVRCTDHNAWAGWGYHDVGENWAVFYFPANGDFVNGGGNVTYDMSTEVK